MRQASMLFRRPLSRLQVLPRQGDRLRQQAGKARAVRSFSEQRQVASNDDELAPLISGVITGADKQRKNHTSSLETHTEVTTPKLEDPKRSWFVDPFLYPHVRSNRSDIVPEDEELAALDTGLSLIMLGTGAGTGSKARSNSAAVLKNGSFSYLIDAGEGLQQQFLRARINFRQVQKIFITHMHGDHILGLPGFLLGLQVAGLNAIKQRPIQIYGPVGLFNFIATSLALSCSELRKIKVEVYELHGGTQRSMRSAGNRKHFPEFHHSGLYRKLIPQNEDGTWTLVEPLEITTPEMAIRKYSTPTGMLVKAAEIHHVPQLQCFGYTFQEPATLPRSIDINLARSNGITAQEGIRLLKAGFPVKSETGDTVLPEQVCGPKRPPRKVTLLGDCCVIPPAMELLAHKSDVLVHEATLTTTEKGARTAKSEMGGHSTAAQAATFANKVGAKVLIMNHLPATADKLPGMRSVIAEAERGPKGPTRVQLGYDHLEILIPRTGFDFSKANSTTETIDNGTRGEKRAAPGPPPNLT